VGELRKVGIEVTKATIRQYRMRPPKPPAPTWKTFLRNHEQDLVALDFFVVPTVTYKVLFVLLILAHHCRQVVHVSVTEHPTAGRTSQQVVDAFRSPGTRRHGISGETAIASTAPLFGRGCRIWGSRTW
jgi:putative transposase